MTMLQGKNGRGVHPRLRSSSVRAYCLDEDGLAALDLMGNADLGQYLALPQPGFLDGADVGGQYKRFFSGPAQSLNGSVADILSMLVGSAWTIHLRVRWRSNAADQTLIHIGGDDGDETAAHNVLFRLKNESGNYRLETENLLGINAGHTFENYTIPLNVWHLVTVRVRSGTVYELFINGRLVETSPNLTAPTGGGSASMMLGATRDTFSVVDPADVDVAGVHIYNAQLDLDQIKDDARRANLLPLHSTIGKRVDVEDPSATMINMSTLEGVDWLDEFSITRDVDDPVATCAVKLRREVGNLSLAYLKTDTKINLTDKADPLSYDPLLDINRGIECFGARTPLFIKPVDDDWQSVFEGNIDTVDWSGERVRLACRDMGGKLVDTYIEEENDLGVGATQTLEQTIQNVLTNSDNLTKPGSYDPVTLYTPIPSTWIQKIQNAQGRQLKQRREPVMSAARTHAGQIGWDSKYLWDPGTEDWRLTLGQPDRSRVDTDMILELRDLLSVQTLKVNAQRVRTDVRIVYPSSEVNDPTGVLPVMPPGITIENTGWLGVDGEGNRTFAFIHVSNTASRNRYGRRFFEIAESAASMIDTIDEAADMAAAIVQDIGEPEALYDIQTPCLFEMNENGMLNILGNAILHTGQQNLSVRSVTHTFGEKPKSSMRMRGKPSVGFNRWLRLGTFPGQARPPTLNPFNTLDDMTVGQLVPFVTGLVDKTNYGANAAKFSGVRNSNFAASTRGSTNPPDSWDAGNFSVVNGWGGFYRYEYTYTRSGRQSIAVLGSAGAGLNMRSDLAPLPPEGENSVLALEWSEARGVAPGTDSRVNLQIFWYAADKTTSLGVSSVYNRANVTRAIGEFVKHREEGIIPPAGAAWYSVRFDGDITNFSSPHYVDSVNLYEMSDECAVTRALSQTGVANSTWTDVELDTATKNYRGSFDLGTFEWTCPLEGSYDMTAGIRAFASGLGVVIDIANVKLQLDTGGGYGDLMVGPGGTFDMGAVNAPVVNSQLQLLGRYFNRGDKVKVQGFLTYSGGAPASVGFTAGQESTYFTAKMRQTE